MARQFVIDERLHPDPDPSLTIEQVRDMFADFYPDLAGATHTVTQRGEDQVIDFRRTVGTKGPQ
jgi:PRTRC genetic system protein C